MIRTEVVVMPSKTKLGKFNIKQYLYVNQVFTPLKIRMGCRSGHPEHTGTLMDGTTKLYFNHGTDKS